MNTSWKVHQTHAYISQKLRKSIKPMQKTMSHKRRRRRRRRRRRGEELENFSPSVEKHNLSHADTQLRLARSHARTRRSRLPGHGDVQKTTHNPQTSDCVLFVCGVLFVVCCVGVVVYCLSFVVYCLVMWCL